MRWALAVLLVAACSANDDFPAPQIASVTPPSATPGSAVVIAGNYFCHQSEEDVDPGGCTTLGTVYFGTMVASALQYDETSITVEVPQGTGTIEITISVAGERSNAASFTFE